jgi:DNA-binding NarL/FixJ family response regulator
MEKIRVLLVDDHTIMREGLRALLGFYEDIQIVGEARNGEEAIDRVDKLRPDVVLMDIAMPGMNGIAATHEIRSRHPETQVLVLSQHEDRQYVLPVINAGAAGYLLKQSVGTELVNAVRAVSHGEPFLCPSATSTLLEEYRGRGPATPCRQDALTPRENEVLAMIARGKTNQEIARSLTLSLKTVEWHRTNLMGKLKLHCAVELTHYALRHHLVNLEGASD